MSEHSEQISTYKDEEDGQALKTSSQVESMHIDPIALNHVSDIMNRLRGGNGYAGVQLAWLDDARPSLRIPFIYDPSQVSADKEATKKAIKAKCTLQSAAKALSSVLELISRQLEICDENVEAFRRRAGFFTLPDEIMVKVLEYTAAMDRRDKMDTVNWVTDQPRPQEQIITLSVKAATRISHVCKRFRDLITHSPNLWNRIHCSMTSNMVSTCLSRCRRDDAIVTLDTPIFKQDPSRINFHYEQDKMPFICTIVENSQKFKQFVLKGNSVHPRRPRVADAFDDIPQEYLALAGEASFPNLEQLTVFYPEAAMSSDLQSNNRFLDAMHFYRQWSTPKILGLSTTNFIPTVILGSRRLTALNISISCRIFSMRDEVFTWDAEKLLLFLAECPNLERFGITLSFAIGANISSKSRNVLTMPRVTRLDVNSSYCDVESLKGFFSAVNFPCVTSMQLNANSRSAREDLQGAIFQDIYYAVIPNAEAFPKLMNLHLYVGISEGAGDDGNLEDSFSIPFATLPHLKHILLCSNARVSPPPDDVALPAIQRLVIANSPVINKNWLIKFLRRMEAQGALDGLKLQLDDKSFGHMQKPGISRFSTSNLSPLFCKYSSMFR